MSDDELTPKRPPPGRDGDWQPVFLLKLAMTANVRASCLAAGISRQWAYATKNSDPAFAAAWQEAMDDALDILESVAFKRAAEVSDTLLIFLLKCHRPGVYRDRIQVDQKTSLEIVEEIVDSPKSDDPAAPDAG